MDATEKYNWCRLTLVFIMHIYQFNHQFVQVMLCI